MIGRSRAIRVGFVQKCESAATRYTSAGGRRLPRIRSEAFSAIMIVGRVGVAARNRWHHGGIDDAQGFEAANVQLRIDYGHCVDAHCAGAGRVHGGAHHLAHVCIDLLVTLNRRAGQTLFRDQRRCGTRGEELTRETQHRAERRAIFRRLQQVEANARRISRALGAQRHFAATHRMKHNVRHREHVTRAASPPRKPGARSHRDGADQELHVRPLEPVT